MEKRRRARINDSLTQLKTLILEATNKDTSRHSKLEKADILEMTVKYLKNLQRHHIVASLDSGEVNATRYRMGYSECIGEVSRFLSPLDSKLVDLRVQLLNHLAQTCTVPSQKQPQQQPTQTLSNGHSVVHTPSPAVAPAAITAHIPQPLQIQVAPHTGNGSTTVQTLPITVTAQPQTTAIAVSSATPVHVKNEATVVTAPQQSPQGVARFVSGIQVGIPTGISGGEIALVIPPQAFPNGQVPSHFIPVYSQHAPVLSPSSAAAAPTASQNLSSPVGTATASLAQLPSSITYQSISGCMTATTTANIPSRNVLPISEVPKMSPTTLSPSTNSMNLPIQSFVTLRSPIQTSHHQSHATFPMKVSKVKCAQEVVAMEDDQSCWRPW
ncbi:transcription factor HES-1-like isoform X2 [Apostichopus japonicus]